MAAPAVLVLGSSRVMHPRFRQMLDAFLRMTRAAGTEVWLVLALCHPDAWSALSADGSMKPQSHI